VVLSCLAFIGGVRDRGPAIAAVWPKGPWVVQWLLVVALLVLSWFLLKHLVVPCLMFLKSDKGGSRTAKAKEKLADSLMSFSTAVSSAVMIGVLVFPLTVFIQAMAKGIDPLGAVASWWPPEWWSWWHTAVFLILFWLPFSISLLFRRRALDLYDELPPPAPAEAPTTPGTCAPPPVSDPGPPVYVRANKGAQHHQRSRTK
jgi:hypothetical protein